MHNIYNDTSTIVAFFQLLVHHKIRSSSRVELHLQVMCLTALRRWQWAGCCQLCVADPMLSHQPHVPCWSHVQAEVTRQLPLNQYQALTVQYNINRTKNNSLTTPFKVSHSQDFLNQSTKTCGSPLEHSDFVNFCSNLGNGSAGIWNPANVFAMILLR